MICGLGGSPVFATAEALPMSDGGAESVRVCTPSPTLPKFPQQQSFRKFG
jgi:hypothetical protein